MLALLEDGATHVGVATDQVIESFRNDLWPGYKSGAGLDPLLEAQFPLLEDALAELGVAVWAMVDYEADDALASAAFLASADPRVEQVVICTPDKDLGQCVGGKVVQLDRRRDKTLDAEAVREKFGVPPASIPDWLALVGDSADGFPGLPGWGAKTAAAVLSRYGRLEEIPDDPNAWDLPGLRGRERLAETLRTSRELAGLFKDLATLRSDADVGRLDDWEWNGALPGFEAWSVRAGLPGLAARAERLQRDRT
jgi:5'-3' exonuclease